MSSIAGIRLGLCLLRHGPQPAVPVMLFCRAKHKVADPRSSNSEKLSSACKMSTVTCQKKVKNLTLDTSELDSEFNIAQSCRRFRRFITDPKLVKKILYCLDPWDTGSTPPLILECNPGPGLLTQLLLKAGCNVVALEENAQFLPGLQKLEKNAGGQLRVLHCDFFRLDPWTDSVVRPPVMYSEHLMEQLGINEVPWDAGVPVKVFGILPHAKEQNLMWRYIYMLYERLSLFRYGRIEFNFFMSEVQYKKLLVKPGDFKQYHPIAVLFNVACDVQLQLKENSSAFFIPKKFIKGPLTGKLRKSLDDPLCLVRLTPRRDLFSERFSPSDGKCFINLVKQCMVKRTSKLQQRLDIWNPGDAEGLLQSLNLPEDIQTGNIYPEEYKLLFEILMHSEDFDQSFVLDRDLSYSYY